MWKVVFTGVSHRPGVIGVHWIATGSPGVNRFLAWAMVNVAMAAGFLTMAMRELCPATVKVTCCAVASVPVTHVQVTSTDPREVKVAEGWLVKADELIAGICQGSLGGLDFHDWSSRPAAMTCPPWEANVNASGSTMVAAFVFAGNGPFPTKIGFVDELVRRLTSMASPLTETPLG